MSDGRNCEEKILFPRQSVKSENYNFVNIYVHYT